MHYADVDGGGEINVDASTSFHMSPTIHMDVHAISWVNRRIGVASEHKIRVPLPCLWNIS